MMGDGGTAQKKYSEKTDTQMYTFPTKYITTRHN